MRTRFLHLWALALLAAVALVVAPAAHISHASASGLVISALYGGGGDKGATYGHDYIELFNAGNSVVDMTGWTVQYRHAKEIASWQKTKLTGTLQPGQYYLLQQRSGLNRSNPLPTPDGFGPADMRRAGNFVVALMSTTTKIAGDNPQNDPITQHSIVDLFGGGDISTHVPPAFEGAYRSGVLDATTAWFRLNNGCQDTDNNLNDFVSGQVYPKARNSSSPLNPCEKDDEDAVELVANGTFENGPSFWTLSALPNRAKVKCGDFGDGSNCALLLKPGAVAKQNGVMAGILAGTPSAAGDLLTVSAAIWSNQAAPNAAITVKVNYATPTAGAISNGKDKVKLTTAEITSGYQTFSSTLTLADAIVSGKVQVKYKLAIGKLRVDDMSVKLTEAGTRGSAISVLPLPAAPGGSANK